MIYIIYIYDIYMIYHIEAMFSDKYWKQISMKYIVLMKRMY